LPKSENKYSKSEYGSVSGVFESPELREKKSAKITKAFMEIGRLSTRLSFAWLAGSLLMSYPATPCQKFIVT
jgi:hypothetical protein